MTQERQTFGSVAFVTRPSTVVDRIISFPSGHLPLFVATEDQAFARDMLRPLLTGLNIALVLVTEIGLPVELAQYAGRVDPRSFASQVDCSNAEYFVGNQFSSFTFEIISKGVFLK